MTNTCAAKARCLVRLSDLLLSKLQLLVTERCRQRFISSSCCEGESIRNKLYSRYRLGVREDEFVHFHNIQYKGIEAPKYLLNRKFLYRKEDVLIETKKYKIKPKIKKIKTKIRIIWRGKPKKT